MSAGARVGSDQIAVIIVNYGTAALAIEAVESVRRETGGRDGITIHLVDNASPGEDAATLGEAHAARGWGEGVRLLLETENHGFGRGNNVVLTALAVSGAPPDKVFLLNPDARLENDAIGILSQALDANPQAAAAGASLLRADGLPVTAAFRFPGLVSEVVRLTGLSVLRRMARRFEVPLPADHPGGDVDWVSGASVMFRFSAIAEAGFFDPGFFLYYEEVDLMRRLRADGWRILHVPDARVIHDEGAATGQFAGRTARQRDPRYMYDSWRHYFARNHGRAWALGLALLMLPAAGVNILHRRLRGRSPTIPLRFFGDQWRHVILPLAGGGGPE